jgi:hypothetical protein
MSIGAVVRRCAIVASTLTLTSVALAEPSSYSTAYDDYSSGESSRMCPDSHGVQGSGYRDMLSRLPQRQEWPDRGLASGGYRDSLGRFPAEAESRGIPSRGVVAGYGYRDSLARFPGTVAGESPRHAVARCGRIDAL